MTPIARDAQRFAELSTDLQNIEGVWVELLRSKISTKELGRRAVAMRREYQETLEKLSAVSVRVPR